MLRKLINLKYLKLIFLSTALGSVTSQTSIASPSPEENRLREQALRNALLGAYRLRQSPAESREAAETSETQTPLLRSINRERSRSRSPERQPAPKRRRVLAAAPVETQPLELTIPVADSLVTVLLSLTTGRNAARIKRFMEGSNFKEQLIRDCDLKNEDALHVQRLLTNSTYTHKLLVSCDDQQCPRAIPFIHYLIWGNCYRHNDLADIKSIPQIRRTSTPGATSLEAQVDPHEAKIALILEVLDVISHLGNHKDQDKISAALLLMHKGYFNTLEKAQKANNDTFYEPLHTAKGNVLLQLIRAHFGDIPIAGFESENCSIPSDLKKKITTLQYQRKALAANKLENFKLFQEFIEQLLEKESGEIIQKLSNQSSDKKSSLLAYTQNINKRGSSNLVHWLIALCSKKKIRISNLRSTDPAKQIQTSLLQNLKGARDTAIRSNPKLLFSRTVCHVTPIQQAAQSSDAQLLKLILTEMLEVIRSNPDKQAYFNTLLLFINLQTIYKSRTPLHALSRNAVGSLTKAAEMAPLSDTIKSILMLRTLNAQVIIPDKPAYGPGCSVLAIAINSARSLLLKQSRESCALQGYTFSEYKGKYQLSIPPVQEQINQSKNLQRRQRGTLPPLSHYTDDQLLGFLILAQYFSLLPGLNDNIIKSIFVNQEAVAPSLTTAKGDSNARAQWARNTIETIDAIAAVPDWRILLGKFKTQNLGELGVKQDLQRSVEEGFDPVWPLLIRVK